MELTVHGKQIDVGDALRTHVSERLEDLNQKYFNHATFATVTFSPEGHGHRQIRAHISIRIGKNIMVIADAVENDPYVSFEAAAGKVAKQLRRYKRRLRDHHDRLDKAAENETTKATKYVISAGSDEPAEFPSGEGASPDGDPVVIAEMATDIETMSVSDAVMRLDLSDQTALMFKNARHGGLNVVYRRTDGNVGWIDPVNEARAKAGAGKAAGK